MALPLLTLGEIMHKAKIVIIGSGPAGYTAAIYAARANLQPVLFEGFYSGVAGGQLMTTTEVENFPGFPQGITGPALVDNFRQQALRFNTTFLSEDVAAVDFSQHPYIVYGTKMTYQADAVIISTGASANRLNIPGANDGEFWQKGVTACAVCDGAMPIFRNKDLYVVGGGDSAVEEALYLTKFASKVYLVHRRDELRASKIMQERAKNHPKVEILWSHVIERIEGDDVVRQVVLKDLKTSQETRREAGGVFFAVGHTPNTAFLKNQLDLHDNGYIKVKPGTCQTSKELVFACGDVQDHVYRQAITAAGTGCMAAIEAERELAARGHI
ncbi:Thioredoxin reductase [Parachlamydia sp. AcF125]|nr:Thioredoxin reductase [Parachlamydia sp. AcF125]